jgi:hypothetical protein
LETSSGDSVRAGDAVVFRWLEGELTGVLVQHPYPEREYLRIRTRGSNFSVPRGDVLRPAPPGEPVAAKPDVMELMSRSSLGGAAWCDTCRHPDLNHDPGCISQGCACTEFRAMTPQDWLAWRR